MTRIHRLGPVAVLIVLGALVAVVQTPRGLFGQAAGDDNLQTVFLPLLKKRSPEPTDATPLCPSHDPTKWHALYDPLRDCHYDHEHHEDPNSVNDIFGPPGAWFGSPGQEISYPWQTFSHHGLENDVKHGGYKWLVRRDLPCVHLYGAQGCLRAVRVQEHFVASSMDAVVRFHSFSVEALAEINGQTSIIRYGGWLDTGLLSVRAATGGFQHVPLPDQDAFPGSSLARREHNFQNGSENFATWYGLSPTSRWQVQVALLSADQFGGVDPANPGQLLLKCPDFQCNLNGSTKQLHLMSFHFSEEWANLTGYVDRYGQIARRCTAVSLDCIPFQFGHAGSYQYRDDAVGRDGVQEYDTSPAATRRGIEWWITHPN